ncbi:MAG: MarR family transcriptional regulator [Acidobacteriota bacterium]|jgi:DNA-binding MarR family transcriptional regulator
MQPPPRDEHDPRDSTARSEAERIADRLHSAAIHLLRRLRQEDAASGLTAPRLSALSVIVFGGPLTLGELAEAEQVRPPTISRLVQGLEADGLVERLPDPDDRRVQRVRATEAGRRLLDEGRARRIRALAGEVATLPRRDRSLLAQAAELLEHLALPPDHPRRDG